VESQSLYTMRLCLCRRDTCLDQVEGQELT
jgi:hypothetical protein